MLSPDAEMKALVRSLEEVSLIDRSHISIAEVRAKVALAIRITHAILHPDCNFGPDSTTLRFALLDLDQGSPQPRITI